MNGIDKVITSNSYSGFVKMSLKLGLSDVSIYSAQEDTFPCVLPPFEFLMCRRNHWTEECAEGENNM